MTRLGVSTSNGKPFSGTDFTDTSSMVDEAPENKDESPPTDLESERKTSEPLCHIEDLQATMETSTEEQNMHRLNANSWCIAVVTIVLCLLFFLYYCFLNYWIPHYSAVQPITRCSFLLKMAEFVYGISSTF